MIYSSFDLFAFGGFRPRLSSFPYTLIKLYGLSAGVCSPSLFPDVANVSPIPRLHKSAYPRGSFRGVATGGIWVYVPPKSVQVNFLSGKNDVRTDIGHEY